MLLSSGHRGWIYVYHGKTCDVCLSVLRYIIGLTFMTSGFLKIVNPDATGQLIVQYMGLLGIGYSGFPLRPVAIAFCVGEILIGVMACVRRVFLIIFPIYVVVILFFVIVTYINLTSPYGGLESCGCFGELVHLGATETFIKNLLLLAMSVALCIRTLRSPAGG